MYYRKALRAAGFDPAEIKDAKISDEFTLHIGLKELRGTEIGHPMKCPGAQACIKQQHATFAWIGASMAILGFADGKLIRYFHNGQLPKKHDQGMFAVGDYKFKHMKESHRPASRAEKRKQNNSIRPHHNSKEIRVGITFHSEPSLAAQMRRGWEVEAG